MTAPYRFDATHKSYPATAAPGTAQDIAQRGWRVLADDLPYPLATVRRSALAHNLQWMQAYAERKGVWLAPHGKTTMSPELFALQLDAGAWGLTFATVWQARVGVQAGARRIIIANQVLADADLDALDALLSATAGLQVLFLVDSLAQLGCIADWRTRRASTRVFDVLLEMGFDGGRTGCRTLELAQALALALHVSVAVRFCGIECYEGQLGTCNSFEGDDGELQRLARHRRHHALVVEGPVVAKRVPAACRGRAGRLGAPGGECSGPCRPARAGQHACCKQPLFTPPAATSVLVWKQRQAHRAGAWHPAPCGPLPAHP